jgi:hypothetical protein
MFADTFGIARLSFHPIAPGCTQPIFDLYVQDAEVPPLPDDGHGLIDGGPMGQPRGLACPDSIVMFMDMSQPHW